MGQVPRASASLSPPWPSTRPRNSPVNRVKLWKNLNRCACASCLACLACPACPMAGERQASQAKLGLCQASTKSSSLAIRGVIFLSLKPLALPSPLVRILPPDQKAGLKAASDSKKDVVAPSDPFCNPSWPFYIIRPTNPRTTAKHQPPNP